MRCRICTTPRPKASSSNDQWCCSIACYRTFHGLDDPVTGDGRLWCAKRCCYVEHPTSSTGEEVVAEHLI